MKYIHTLFIVFAFTLYSCSDFLLEEPVNDLTTKVVYSNVDGLKSAVVGLYNLERERYTIHAEGNNAFSIMCGTDISTYRAAGDEGAAKYNEKMSPSNSVVAYNWTNYYEIIERSNSIIHYATNEVDMAEEVQGQILSEACCARAHAYFHLLRLFDNIPLKTNFTTSISDEKYKPAKQSDILHLINTDLDYAVEHLDYSRRPGRYNKAVAMHLRAKVALYENDWEKAADMATTLISESGYALLDNPNEVFSPADLDHDEALYVYHFDISEPTDDRKYHRMPILFNTRYNLTKGLKHDNQQGGYSWGRLYPNKYLLGLYTKNDTRLNAFYKIYYTYNDEKNLPVGVSMGDTVKTDDIPYETYYKSLHPSLKKYWDNGKSEEAKESYKDIIVYRLAETYLIAAEALLHLDRKTEALSYINKVRERAVGPTGYLDTIDEDVVLEERARELSFEGHRWYTLKRTGKLVERVRQYSGEGNYIDSRENIKDHHVRRPIPLGELQLMDNYPQNSDYE